MRRCLLLVAALALALPVAGAGAHESELGPLPLAGQYQVEVTTQHLGGDAWRFTYTITNLTEVGEWDEAVPLPEWAQGIDHTGLDGLFVRVPKGASVTNVQIPPSYRSGGWWDYIGPYPNDPVYDQLNIWGNDPRSIYPVGEPLVFAFDVEPAAVGVNDAYLTTFWLDHAIRWPGQDDRIFTQYHTTLTSPVPTPATVVSTVEDAIAAGTLVGSGPQASAATGRLGAFVHMLDKAQALVAAGHTRQACDQLWDAYRRVDGDPKPPDFASGPDAPAIAGGITDLRSSLGCG